MPNTDKFEIMLDNILTYMNLSDFAPPRNQRGLSTVKMPINFFNGAEPFRHEDIDAQQEIRQEECYLSPGCVSFDDIDNTLDTKVISESPCVGAMFDITRLRKVPLKRIRGQYRMPMKHMMEMAVATVFKSGVYTVDRVIYGSNPVQSDDGLMDYRFKMIGQGRRPSDEVYQIDDDEKTRLAMLISMQYTNLSRWLVTLGYNNGVLVGFRTDITGVAEVFKLRDIPNGKKRRDALKHWVRNHWRKKHDDPTAKSYVRKHLRGSDKFLWNGLTCNIVPSKFAIDEMKKTYPEKSIQLPDIQTSESFT